MKAKGVAPPTLGFVVRFAVMFGLLIAPWPGWNQAYGEYFRGFGQWIFSGESDARVVMFAPLAQPGDGLDTQVSVADRTQLDANGRGPIKRTGLESRSLGWLPTALTAALILATPIPWGRRVAALCAGVVLIHLFIAFSLLIWIWDNSPDVFSGTLSDLWKLITSELSYAFVTQLGISFTIPVLIWVLVTFKRQDALTNS